MQASGSTAIQVVIKRINYDRMMRSMEGLTVHGQDIALFIRHWKVQPTHIRTIPHLRFRIKNAFASVIFPRVINIYNVKVAGDNIQYLFL